MEHIYHRFETSDLEIFEEVKAWFSSYGIDESGERDGVYSFYGQYVLNGIEETLSNFENLCKEKPMACFKYVFNLDFLYVTVINQQGILGIAEEDLGYVPLPEPDRIYMFCIDTDCLDIGFLALKYDNRSIPASEKFTIRFENQRPVMTAIVFMDDFNDYFNKIAGMINGSYTRIVFDESVVNHGQWGDLVYRNGKLVTTPNPMKHKYITNMIFKSWKGHDDNQVLIVDDVNPDHWLIVPDTEIVQESETHGVELKKITVDDYPELVNTFLFPKLGAMWHVLVAGFRIAMVAQSVDEYGRPGAYVYEPNVEGFSPFGVFPLYVQNDIVYRVLETIKELPHPLIYTPPMIRRYKHNHYFPVSVARPL